MFIIDAATGEELSKLHQLRDRPGVGPRILARPGTWQQPGGDRAVPAYGDDPWTARARTLLQAPADEMAPGTRAADGSLLFVGAKARRRP